MTINLFFQYNHNAQWVNYGLISIGMEFTAILFVEITCYLNG
jgi:hypothetical protein